MGTGQCWFLAGLAALTVIFGLGVTGLYLNLRFVTDTPVTWHKALYTGLLLFLPAEAIKLTLAGLLWKRLRPLTAMQGAAHD